MLNLTQTILLYMGVMVLSGVSIFFAKKMEKKYYIKWGLIFVSWFSLFFIMAFRYDVGTDYFYTYIPAFKNIFAGKDAFPNEYGFYLINKFLQMFTSNAQSIIIFCSFIYVTFFIWAIYDNSDNLLLSVITLFLMTLFFVALNNVRQHVAVVLVLWSFRFVKERKLVPFILILLLCSFFFHQTAFMAIIIYFIYNWEWLRKKCYYIMAISLIAVPICSNLILLLMRLLGYGDYISSMISLHGNSFLLTQNIMVMLVYTMAFKNKVIEDRSIFGIYFIQWIAVLVAFSTFFLNIAEIPDRMSYYFMIFQVIGIPMAINMVIKEDFYLFTMLAVFLGYTFILSFTSIVIAGYHETVPYQFVFGHWKELDASIPLNLPGLYQIFGH